MSMQRLRWSQIFDLRPLMVHKIEFISEASERLGSDMEEHLKQVNDDVELFNKSVGSSIKRLKEASSSTNLQEFKRELQTENSSNEIELGKSTSENEFRDDEDTEKIIIQHLEAVVEKIRYTVVKVKRSLRDEYLLVCIDSLAREAPRTSEMTMAESFDQG